jgi:hypothetical protein
MFIWILLTLSLAIKTNEVNATPSINLGKFCEKIAFEQVNKEYQNKPYTILSNVEYYDEKSAGELDLIVINKDNRITKIFEVKCLKDSKKAHKRSLKQRQRFIKALQTAKRQKDPLQLKFKNKSKQIRYQQFYYYPEWKTISYNSQYTRDNKFKVFPYTYEEIVCLFYISQTQLGIWHQVMK